MKTITTGSEKDLLLILLQDENGDNEIFWLRPHSAMRLDLDEAAAPFFPPFF